MNFKKIMAAAVASVMAMGTMAVAANAFSAGLMYQTNAWTFRNTIAQSKAIWWDPDFGDAMDYDTWIVKDVEITGDGTYTVSFEKDILEDCKDGPESSWNQLKLLTDIPSADYPDVQITIDKLTVDGVEFSEAKNAALGTSNLTVDEYADGYNGIKDTVVDAYLVGFYNTWNPDETVLDGSASFGGKVEVTFTITGLGGGDAASEDDGNAGDGTAADNNTVGDTTTTTSDKTNADTGVEGVAVVAGIAVLAAGAIIVAKKRK